VIHETADIQQFAQAVKSKDGPDGIFGIANDQLANYIDAGLVEEVPDDVYANEDYVAASVQACYSDGKRFGVPIAVETNVLFYNTDKIKEVPNSWEEMIEIARDQGGIQFDATSIYYNLGFLRAYDSYIFKYDDGSYDVEDIGLGDAGAIEAYTFLNRLSNEYDYITSDITNDTAKGNFQNQESAFFIGGPWDIDGFTTANTPFAVASMPSLNGKDFVTPVGTQVGFVSSKSENKDLVFEFYKYLIENASDDLYTVGKRIPANLKAQDSIEKNDYNQAFIEQIGKGEPLPTVSELGQVWTPYADNMKLMYEQKITPEEAAAYIDEQVTEGIELMNSGK
ncbi:MAG TPA: extracellular solute-binding protein, partial [Candidatus Merdenecus merdavium]|nr:extracellular solute-binding protein [Candidatus Merdenecus merdavium]